MKNTRQGNRAGRSAVIEIRMAALSTEFGMKMLHSKFPEQVNDIINRLGTYSRGPRKGMVRGYIHWEKVIEGGFDYRMDRRQVVRPGTQCWDVKDAKDVSVVGELNAEKMKKEQDEYRLVHSMTPVFARCIERATRCRMRAMEALRDNDNYLFCEEMLNARRFMKEARSLLS